MEAHANHGRQRIHANCWVDWNRQGIWRDRHFVPLPPRTFRILSHLIHHAGRMVTQTELLAVGWDEARSPWDLYAQIHRLRQTIEPNPTHPKWLVTRRGAGYLLYMDPPSR